MTMPRFAAEASLYKTSGHYRTGGHINSSAQTGSRVWPAVREQGGEVIDVCEDDPSKCWPPPLTEPPVGGGDGWPPGGGPTDPGFGPGGGGGTPPGPRHCHRSDFGSEDEFELAGADRMAVTAGGDVGWGPTRSVRRPCFRMKHPIPSSHGECSRARQQGRAPR